jgi:hypothetical protein
MKVPKGFLFSTCEVVLQIDDRLRSFTKILGPQDPKGPYPIPQDPNEREEYLVALENYVFLSKCIAEWAEIHKDCLEKAKQMQKDVDG